MAWMGLFEMTGEGLCEVSLTTFREAQVHERYDLQRVLRDNINVIADGALVIAEEFSEWEESARRIDLLAVDPDGTLVVIELKRTRDGGFMDLQAVRYAAMVSAMTFDRAVHVYQRYLAQIGQENENENARTALLEHLADAEEEEFGGRVRIVLASMDFGKELTTAVMWLNDQGLDIRCVRLTPYTLDDRVLLDVQQIIPLPEANDYIVQLKQKAIEERRAQRERAEWTGWWFVNVGMDSPNVPESNGRHWHNCQRHGYLCAGGGRRWSDRLKKLQVGDKVFAYVKGRGGGYVGCGTISRTAMPVHKYMMQDGRSLQETVGHWSNETRDPSDWEYAVGVDWLSTVSLDDARTFKGAFAIQTNVCKLRDPETLRFLAEQFKTETGTTHRNDAK